MNTRILYRKCEKSVLFHRSKTCSYVFFSLYEHLQCFPLASLCCFQLATRHQLFMVSEHFNCIKHCESLCKLDSVMSVQFPESIGV